MQAVSEQLNFVKVPVIITLVFWVIKILATTVGETGADFLIFNLNIGLSTTSMIMGGLLLAVLYFQVSAKKYIPWLYWLSVVMVSIVGTLMTDYLTDELDVPLTLSTTGFTIALFISFGCWYKVERTLSIHSIFTFRRELFYWAAILLTFALGTAAGDLLSESVGLGYVVSGLIFAGLIGVITAGFYLFNINGVLAFWLAYILTRPLGASIGDYLSQPPMDGGLGLGTVSTSAVFVVTIIALVIYLTRSQIDVLPINNSQSKIRGN